jgi:hypothetical protein
MQPATIAPGADEYAQQYRGYVARVPQGNVLDQLERQGASTAALLARVTRSGRATATRTASGASRRSLAT